MDNHKIELMTESDLPSVAQIFLDVFNGLGENWSLETAEKHVKENFSGDYHYVGRLDNEIVGFVLAFPITREKGTELFIDSICVKPEVQKHGIGNLLLKTITDQALEKKYIGLRLLANKNLASFGWYKSMNFMESGWVEVYKEL